MLGVAPSARSNITCFASPIAVVISIFGIVGRNTDGIQQRHKYLHLPAIVSKVKLSPEWRVERVLTCPRFYTAAVIFLAIF